LLVGTHCDEIVEVVKNLLENDDKVSEIEKIKIPINQGATESIVAILKNKKSNKIKF
jgi:UDP-N-acetylglucosamine 2-epimerase